MMIMRFPSQRAINVESISILCQKGFVSKYTQVTVDMW